MTEDQERLLSNDWKLMDTINGCEEGYNSIVQDNGNATQEGNEAESSTNENERISSLPHFEIILAQITTLAEERRWKLLFVLIAVLSILILLLRILSHPLFVHR